LDLTYTQAAEEFRAEVRSFLGDNLPEDWAGLGTLPAQDRTAFLTSWRETLRTNRMLAPWLPEQYGGRGLGVLGQSVLAEEFVRAGVPLMPAPNDGLGFMLLAPTLLHWGTERQKAHFLPRLMSGEHCWAQGFSEPGAGSDLFSLATSARRDGEQWIVNGQKVWQTAGVTANWIFALVRTDTEATRSRGISFMLIPLDQPGVEVRGITNMAGRVELAAVFFDDARAPADSVVGGVNNGATVALTLLGYERGAGGTASAATLALELQRLVDLARAKGRSGDPLVRQAVATCCEKVHVLRCLGLRGLTAGASGAAPGPESSILKLFTAEYRKTVTELAVLVLGGDALAPEGAASLEALVPQPLGFDPTSARGWVDDFLHARAGTIYGGSSQVQRDTIAEQILGLPREPRSSRSQAAR
jgi:alkylation response protein AidB-like acyl-CoA dehydrogenase